MLLRFSKASQQQKVSPGATSSLGDVASSILRLFWSEANILPGSVSRDR